MLNLLTLVGEVYSLVNWMVLLCLIVFLFEKFVTVFFANKNRGLENNVVFVAYTCC